MTSLMSSEMRPNDYILGICGGMMGRLQPLLKYACGLVQIAVALLGFALICWGTARMIRDTPFDPYADLRTEVQLQHIQIEAARRQSAINAALISDNGVELADVYMRLNRLANMQDKDARDSDVHTRLDNLDNRVTTEHRETVLIIERLRGEIGQTYVAALEAKEMAKANQR